MFKIKCNPIIYLFKLILHPPSVPTSAPLGVSVEDVNSHTLTIKWSTPETIGDSGLEGYSVEWCKNGSKSANASEHVCVLCVRAYSV